MAVNDIYQVVIEQLLHGQKILNVLHYRVQTDETDPLKPNGSQLADAVSAIVVPSMKSFQSSELSHVAVYAQKIRPLPAQLAFVDLSAAGPGLVAGNSLPTSMAAVVTKRTANAGRKYRGRVFIAGVPSASEDNSNVSAAALPGLAALADNIDATLTNDIGVYKPVIFHRASSTFTDVTTALARTILRNQRRRQVGVGT